MIAIPSALAIFGFFATLLGLRINRRLMRATGEYRSDSESESDRLAADRSMSLAISYPWFLVAVGIGALAFAPYLQFWVRI